MKYIRSIVLFAGFGLGMLTTQAQTRKTENLIIVGWDGVRWEEIFTGIDSSILNDRQYTRERSELRSRYWSDTAAVRRKKLFPFFWSTIRQDGQLYGNRDLGNKAEIGRAHV